MSRDAHYLVTKEGKTYTTGTANLMITPFFLLAGMAARGKSSVASSVETVQGRSTEEFTRLPGLPGLWTYGYTQHRSV
jgi:hypothetical protein